MNTKDNFPLVNYVHKLSTRDVEKKKRTTLIQEELHPLNQAIISSLLLYNTLSLLLLLLSLAKP